MIISSSVDSIQNYELFSFEGLELNVQQHGFILFCFGRKPNEGFCNTIDMHIDV